jgi:hypothetical protein
MSLNDGKIAWYLSLGDEFLYKSIMFANNDIYVFSDKNYKNISPIKGELKNTVKVKLKLYANPVSIDGVLYGVGLI